MKIAIDARFYRKSTGGIGRYTRALLRELVKIDHKNQYHIYLTKEDMREFNISSKNFFPKIVDITHYTFSEQTKLLKELNHGKFDLVHFSNFNHPLFYRGKFIITIHDLTLMLYPPTKKKHSLIKKVGLSLTMKNAVKKAQKIIAVSEATKNDIVKILGADPKKIEVIYEGVDQNYNNKLMANGQKLIADRYQIQKPYLLFVSQWRPHKGILQLIKAFEILKKHYKLKHKLVIVGKANADFPEIPYAIRHTPYADDIITPGFIDEKDLPEIYRRADLYVFPSHYEGFGLGPLEAMACGTPVISSNTSCMPETLSDAALYFDPFDPLDISKKIYHTLYDKNLKSAIIEKGLDRVKKFSWLTMAKKTLKLYQNL